MSRIVGWFWRHKKTSGVLIVFLVLLIIGLANQPSQTATTQTPLLTPTNLPATVVPRAPSATQVPTAVPASKQQPSAAALATSTRRPTATARATSTSQPTASQAPTKMPTATPVPSSTSVPTATTDNNAQARADFRDFYGHLVEIENACTDASGTASTALTAAEKDQSQMLAAYDAAKAAHDTCDAAGQHVVVMSPPEASLRLRCRTRWTPALGAWMPFATCGTTLPVRSTPARSTCKRNPPCKGTSAIRSPLATESADMVEASLTLNVPTASITPIYSS